MVEEDAPQSAPAPQHPAPDTQHPTPGRRLAINTAIVGGAFVLSRVLGLVREAVIAGRFGTSPQYDAYVVVLAVYRCTLHGQDPWAENVAALAWVAAEDFADYPFPGADQRTLDLLLKES